jgi:hypothetical protein
MPDLYGLGNSMWGDKMVFFDTTPEKYPEDIRGYDFTKKEFFPVIDDDEHQIWPRMHKNRVVYMDFRLGNGQPTQSWENAAVFMKDLTTGTISQITNGSAIAAYPDIHENIIIWMDYRHCSNPHDKYDFTNVEIYGYNLTTQKEFRITNLPGKPKANPRIWGNKVFVDMAVKAIAWGNAIFMFDMPLAAQQR